MKALSEMVYLKTLLSKRWTEPSSASHLGVSFDSSPPLGDECEVIGLPVKFMATSQDNALT